jgi:hypothetical protein
MSWSGTDHQVKPEQYVQNLTHSDILEIEAAVKHFQSMFPEPRFSACTDISKGLGLARGLANPETFPLSENLAKRLRSITEVVYDGRGFLVLRGIQPALYTEEERVIMYAGLTSYVANSRARNIGVLEKPYCTSDSNTDEYQTIFVTVPMQILRTRF